MSAFIVFLPLKNGKRPLKRKNAGLWRNNFTQQQQQHSLSGIQFNSNENFQHLNNNNVNLTNLVSPIKPQQIISPTNFVSDEIINEILNANKQTISQNTNTSNPNTYHPIFEENSSPEPSPPSPQNPSPQKSISVKNSSTMPTTMGDINQQESCPKTYIARKKELFDNKEKVKKRGRPAKLKKIEEYAINQREKNSDKYHLTTGYGPHNLIKRRIYTKYSGDIHCKNESHMNCLFEISEKREKQFEKMEKIKQKMEQLDRYEELIRKVSCIDDG